MLWAISHRFDRRALPLADRHYSRQKIGTPQFVPPAPHVVLLTADEKALWVVTAPLYAQHAWHPSWICTLFRNEGAGLSSALIIEAMSATRYVLGEPPANGIVTFVKDSAVRHKRDPGRCFIKAGFVRLAERTKVHGHTVLQMLPDAMPEPLQPLGVTRALF